MPPRFATKKNLCLLALAVLSAASGSAFAQGAEYRRGYDQGYRDGLAAQGGQGQSRGSRRIHIEQAIYGMRDGTCDASETMHRIASGRRQVSVKADNELCGDPAPRRPKHLDVRYRCGDGPAQRISTREGAILTINCN